MADLTITAANVLPGLGAFSGSGIAGETITAGMSLYRKTSDGKLYKASAANTNPTQNSRVVGVAVAGASAGQTVNYYKGGQIFIGATTVVGQVYVQSANAGGIAPAADLVATNYTTVIGVADTTSTILLAPGFLANQQQHG